MSTGSSGSMEKHPINTEGPSARSGGFGNPTPPRGNLVPVTDSSKIIGLEVFPICCWDAPLCERVSMLRMPDPIHPDLPCLFACAIVPAFCRVVIPDAWGTMQIRLATATGRTPQVRRGRWPGLVAPAEFRARGPVKRSSFDHEQVPLPAKPGAVHSMRRVAAHGLPVLGSLRGVGVRTEQSSGSQTSPVHHRSVSITME